MAKIKNSRFRIMIAIILATIITISCLGVFAGVFGDSVKYAIKDGLSNYKIVISETAEGNEKNAAKELQTFISEATGTELPIITDSGLSAGGRYFSVGNTAFVPSAVSDTAAARKSTGYVIKTVGDTVYLLGKTANGTLNSVYGYLNRALGFEYYFTDVYSLNKSDDLALGDYDLPVDPDIEFMTNPSVGFIQANADNKLRFNSLSTAEIFIPANGNTQVHNILKIMPETLKDSHPNWFATDTGKTTETACFTAHGDSTEYNAMQAHFLNVIKEGMKISSANYFLISQPDNAGFCGCSSCNGLSYNHSGIMVKFCNDLCDKVYKWFETEDGAPYERDFKLICMAYQDTKADPVGITCGKNVGVYIAFDDFGGSYAIDTAGINSTDVGIVRNWANKTDTLMFWLYDVNFTGYCYPYDTSLYKQDFYKLIKEVNGVLVNDESQYNNYISGTAWNNLKSYISCKLRWNVNAEVAVLTENFFKACYKDGWDEMKDVYDSELSWWETLRSTYASGEKHGDLFYAQRPLNYTGFWPKATIQGWISGIESALTAIAGLETTDKASYDKAYKMICAEMVSPLYMLIDLYGSTYSESELTALKTQFKTYATASGVKYYYSSGKISDLLADWGI